MNEPYNYDPMTGEPLREGVPASFAQMPFADRGFQTDQPQTEQNVQTPKTPRVRAAFGKRSFTAKEKCLAWCSILMGYLFCRTFWVWQKPAYGLIFTVLLFVFAFVFFGRQKRKARSLFYPVSAIILSSALFFSGSPVLLFFVFVYSCFAFLMFCQTGSETALEGHAGQLYVFETVKALFVSPFKSIGAVVGAIGSGRGGKKAGKTILVILAGIGIAVLPTFAVLKLLSFDANFTGMLDAVRTGFFDGLFLRFWSLVFGVPVGMYVFGALFTSANPVPDAYNEENCIRIENKMKFAPPLVGAVAILPLLFLYGVFIIAQNGYYKAIFTSTLPDAYTFAEFARDGFFRLCVVAAINALALTALRVFSRKTDKGRISPVVKIYTVVLSLVTIVISGTAISQMIMYVSAYGLTRLRIYTLWFMALLILLFFIAVLKQFAEKLPFAAIAVTVFVLCFGALAIPDTDAFIARHNYNCYIAGTASEIDVEYLGRLAPSSVPVLCEIAEDENVPGEIREKASGEVDRYFAEKKETYDLPSFNLPSILAERARRADE